MTTAAAPTLDVRLMHAVASLLGLAAVMALVVQVLVWAASHPIFRVREIVVEGDTQHQSIGGLRAALVGKLEGGFFALDLSDLKQAFEAVPWVRAAVVQRQFPAGLRLQLQEHRVYGVWGAEPDNRWVNAFGEIFEVESTGVEDRSLPKFMGRDHQAQEMLVMHQSLTRELAGLGLSIHQIEGSGEVGWKVWLNTGTQVELGGGDRTDVVQRFRKFILTHALVLSVSGIKNLRHIESVDLRHIRGYAIRARSDITQAQTAPVL